MNVVMKSLFVFAALIGVSTVSSATPITGGIRLSPTTSASSSAITFDSNHVEFTPNSAVVDNSTIKSSGPNALNSYTGLTATLQSFDFANAAGVKLFTVTNTFDTLSFVISDLRTVLVNDVQGMGSYLVLMGTGTFTETRTDLGALLGFKDFTATSGKFSLTASNTGAPADFELTSSTGIAATPEPGSLALLGTGLLGIAGMARRRLFA